jgi:hypothetical protein
MDRWEVAGPGLVRIAVPSGWLYRDCERGTLCFVPHPQLLGGIAPPAPRLDPSSGPAEARPMPLPKVPLPQWALSPALPFPAEEP